MSNKDNVTSQSWKAGTNEVHLEATAEERRDGADVTAVLDHSRCVLRRLAKLGR